MTDDDLARYARTLVSARIPEMSVDDLIAILTGSASPLTVETLDMVLDVIDAFEDKLGEIERAVKGGAGEPA
jgi:hypothetical protein